jgi:hypothetical protein
VYRKIGAGAPALLRSTPRSGRFSRWFFVDRNEVDLLAFEVGAHPPDAHAIARTEALTGAFAWHLVLDVVACRAASTARQRQEIARFARSCKVAFRPC